RSLLSACSVSRICWSLSMSSRSRGRPESRFISIRWLRRALPGDGPKAIVEGGEDLADVEGHVEAISQLVSSSPGGLSRALTPALSRRRESGQSSNYMLRRYSPPTS